jgi:hypothetical protein
MSFLDDLCHICFRDRDTLQDHHISYDPEMTIQTCLECHNRIHNEANFRDELKPDMTREEAKEAGIVSEWTFEESTRLEDRAEYSVGFRDEELEEWIEEIAYDTFGSYSRFFYVAAKWMMEEKEDTVELIRN